MARRRPAGHRDRPRRVTAGATPPDTPWPNIQFLIEDGGNITLGQIDPIPCAAIAADAHGMLAALVRHKDETLIALLDRLDAALDTALTHQIFTDEING